MLRTSGELLRRCVGFSLAWSLLFAGCGGARGDLARVRGNVKLDGQPLAEALVEYISQGETGVVSMGRTDASGNYEMMATRTAWGASVGVNKVRITTYARLQTSLFGDYRRHVEHVLAR